MHIIMDFNWARMDAPFLEKAVEGEWSWNLSIDESVPDENRHRILVVGQWYVSGGQTMP